MIRMIKNNHWSFYVFVSSCFLSILSGFYGLWSALARSGISLSMICLCFCLCWLFGYIAVLTKPVIVPKDLSPSEQKTYIFHETNNKADLLDGNDAAVLILVLAVSFAIIEFLL